MQPLIILLMVAAAFFYIAAEEQVAIDVSLEECLKIASEKSLRTISASLEEKDIDLAFKKSWFDLLPELGYQIGYAQENHTYTYTGEGTAVLPYYYNVGNESMYISDTDLTARGNIKQELYLSKRFDISALANLLQDEKNKQLRKEIIRIALKSFLTDQVRNNYYRILLYKEALKKNG